MLSWGRSKNGQSINQSSIMQEDYGESISLTLRTTSSKKPLRMPERNWKHQWLTLCFAKHATKVRKRRPVARLMISSLSWHVSWKPVNPQECVWEKLYRNIMRTISKEKETIHYSITIWYTNLFLCLKQWRNPQQKQRWTRNGKNWRKFRFGNWRKSKVRKMCSMQQERPALQFILHH